MKSDEYLKNRNPSIPWCSNCGSMMPVLAEPVVINGEYYFDHIENAWFECFDCGEIISFQEGQERVREQKNEED